MMKLLVILFIIKQEAYEKIITIARTNDYTAGNLLDYLYHQKYYELISRDLSRKLI